MLHAHEMAGLTKRHTLAVEYGVEAGCGLVSPRATPGVILQSPQRENSEVLPGDGIVVESRTPQLNQGAILPRRRPPPPRANAPPESENLSPGELEPVGCHVGILPQGLPRI